MVKDGHVYALSELVKGDEALIERLTGTGEIRNRLLEMGLVKGTEVSLIRVAPMGDPLVVLVHGFQLSLRKEEASFVIVKILKRKAKTGLCSRLRKGGVRAEGKKG